MAHEFHLDQVAEDGGGRVKHGPRREWNCTGRKVISVPVIAGRCNSELQAINNIVIVIGQASGPQNRSEIASTGQGR